MSLLALGASIYGGYCANRYVVQPWWFARKNKEYLAPDFVQKQAKEFMNAMTENRMCGKLSTCLKNGLGYTMVYQGTKESFFKNEPMTTVAMARLDGIHFRKNSFQRNQPVTDEQLPILCHEVSHIYNGDILYKNPEQLPFGVGYKSEYKAEQMTVKTLNKLNKHSALAHHVHMRLSQYCQMIDFDKLSKHFNTEDDNPFQAKSPYIYGTLDTFYENKDIHEKNKKLKEASVMLTNLEFKPANMQERLNQYHGMKLSKIFHLKKN